MTHEEAIQAVLAVNIERFGIPYFEALETEDVEVVVKAYLEARRAILCDIEPEVWTNPSTVDSGSGCVKLHENDVIWDFAAQNWGNATVPLYSPLDPTPTPRESE